MRHYPDSCANSSRRLPTVDMIIRPVAKRLGISSTPLTVGRMLEPGGHQHAHTPPVWEDTDHADTSSNLVIQPSNSVVCSNSLPALRT